MKNYNLDRLKYAGGETEEVELINDNQERTLKIGQDLDSKVKVNLITLPR